MDAQAVSYESDAAPASENASGLDPGALLGLLSMLGGGDVPRDTDQSAPSTSGGSADRASELLSALSPYLQDTRVLSVDRVIRLLETARGLRGILHSVGPILGDFLGGKS